MPDRINQHGFPEGVVVCTYCGTHESNKDTQGCIYRDAPPRPVPASIFASLGDIGAEMRSIRVREGREVAEPPEGI